jgi:hypothetical protein
MIIAKCKIECGMLLNFQTINEDENFMKNHRWDSNPLSSDEECAALVI